jgi:hypothetical protein
MEPNQTRHALLILESAAQGIKGEAVLRGAGFDGALIPIPRTLSAKCGICLRVPARDGSAAQAVLAEAGIAVADTHEQ